MVDRVSASIILGGIVSAADYAELSSILAAEDLSIEWDGERFAPYHRTVGSALRLYSHEVAWGRFDRLEAWCVEKNLPFARWCEASSGKWGGQRVVFTGDGEPEPYAADEEDYIVIPRQTIESLGSYEAVIAYFDAADFKIPPLIVEGDEVAT